MTTFFVVSFLVGLGLSVISFVSGLEHVNVFDHVFHGHHGHGPRIKVLRHAGAKKARASALNLAAITAFLVWFGGGGLLMQRLTPWAPWLIVGGAVVIGLAGGSLINKVINALATRESTAESLTMIGTIAKTTMPIRALDGTGEIVFTHQGTRQVAGARSDSGNAVDKGAEVVVTRYEKGIAYVATWDELTPRGNQEEAKC
jgi:hypothetical protein